MRREFSFRNQRSRKRAMVGLFAAFLLLSLLASLPAFCADLALLRNGFSIRYQHREVRNDVTRLYLWDSTENFVDVPSADIVSFEQEEEDPPQAKPIPTAKPVFLEDVILTASRRNHLDPDLVMSLIRVESAFEVRAVSTKGAQGLMQLMPSTATELGVSDPLDPVANVEGGTRYLAGLLARFNNNPILALAAYNAGPQHVQQYQGVPPYLETRQYVAKVMADLGRTKAVKRKVGSQANPPYYPNVSKEPAGRLRSASASKVVYGPSYQAQVYPRVPGSEALPGRRPGSSCLR